MGIWHCPACGHLPTVDPEGIERKRICTKCGSMLAEQAGAESVASSGQPKPIPGTVDRHPPAHGIPRSRRVWIGASAAALAAGVALVATLAYDAWLIEGHNLRKPTGAVVALGSGHARVRALARAELVRMRDALQAADKSDAAKTPSNRAFLQAESLRADFDEALPFLTPHLTDPDPALSGLVREILLFLGPDAAAELAKTMSRPDDPNRIAAARLLGELGARARVARRSLARTVGDREAGPEIRLPALSALLAIGGHDPARAGSLVDRPFPALVASADAAIAGEAIALCAALEDDAIALFVSDPAQAVGGLLRRAAGANGRLSGPAAEVLTRWGAAAGEATVRHAAATPVQVAPALEFLSTLHQPVAGAESIALAAFVGDDPDARAAAIRYLARGREASDGSYDALVQALAWPDESMRAVAAEGVSRLPLRRAAIPELIDALNDDSAAVRSAIAAGFRTLPAATDNEIRAGKWMPRDPAAAVPPRYFAGEGAPAEARPLSTVVAQRAADLMRRAADPNPEVRRAVLRALSWAGEAAAAQVPDLLGALQDPDARVRAQAAETLGAVAPQAPEVIPALLGRLRDRIGSVRTAAATALARSGPAAVEGLTALLKDPNPEVVIAAALALGPLQGDSEAALQLIEQALQGRHSDTHAALLRAVSASGGMRDLALPTLQRLINNPMMDPKLRRSVQDLLERGVPLDRPPGVTPAGDGGK